MLRKLKKWSFFILFNFSSYFYGDLISQKLVCVNYTKLVTDSKGLHDYGYPYLRLNKTVNAAGKETGIVIYFQDFYKYLLYDIDTLNFELFNCKNNISRTIKVPVNEQFQKHKVEPKYQINAFYVVENKLYLLVFNTIYVYEISNLAVCRFLKSYETSQSGFEWFTMGNNKTGVFFKSLTESSQRVQFLKFKIKNNKIRIIDTLNLHFDGLKYLRSESSFISDDNNTIVLGNATSSKIVIIDKSSLKVKNSFYHSNLVNSKSNDTPNYNNKFDLHKSIYSDSNNYHYQTCYFSNNNIFRSRGKIVGKFPHLFDVYQLTINGCDSIQTLCEGLYNFRKYRDSSDVFGIMHFDPMSSVGGRIALNGSLYSVGFSYETVMDFTEKNIPYYKFPISELRQKGKSVVENKKYNFTLYEYKVVN